MGGSISSGIGVTTMSWGLLNRPAIASSTLNVATSTLKELLSTIPRSMLAMDYSSNSQTRADLSLHEFHKRAHGERYRVL